MSLNSFAGIVPRLNCVGSEYNKQILTAQEVQEDKVLLEYRSGGAAFANVFYGELNDKIFIVVLNNSTPVNNLQGLPVSMGIYEAKEGKTLAEKNAVLFANTMGSKVEVSLNNKTLTLSCSRLSNPN